MAPFVISNGRVRATLIFGQHQPAEGAAEFFLVLVVQQINKVAQWLSNPAVAKIKNTAHDVFLIEQNVVQAEIPVQQGEIPGQFMTEQEMWEICAFEVRGKWVRITGEEVTAWVQPERRPDGRPWLLEVGPGGWRLGYYYELERPEDWEPWTAETFKRWEEEDRARQAEQAKKAESQS